MTNFFSARQVLDLSEIGSQSLFVRNTSGMALQAEGTAYGVFAHAGAIGGAAVYAVNGPDTGSGYGVFAETHSPSSVASVAYNRGGGLLFSGRSLDVNGVPTQVFKVDGGGHVFATAYNVGGADFAESVTVSGEKHKYEPGEIMVIADGLRRTVTRSASAYSSAVAGIYSTKPGLIANPHGIDNPNSLSEIPLGIVGIVPAKVSAENGAIKPGDLLVTASLPGHAMKGTDRTRMLGAVVGKALEPLSSGTGVVQVLLTLQ